MWRKDITKDGIETYFKITECIKYQSWIFEIENKNILVVGGGTVALRKIEKLSPFKPSITVVSPKICEEILKFNVKAVEREFDDNDLNGAFCVISATDNEQVNSHIG